jgi:hypothetical protein
MIELESASAASLFGSELISRVEYSRSLVHAQLLPNAQSDRRFSYTDEKW